MAELDIPRQEDKTRDDYLTLAGHRFALLDDMRAATVEWWMGLDPAAVTVGDRLRMMRECLPEADHKRFDQALAEVRLSRDQTILLTNFVVEVYGKGRGGRNGRPPQSPAGSAKRASGTATTSQGGSRSPAKQSGRSASKER